MFSRWFKRKPNIYTNIYTLTKELNCTNEAIHDNLSGKIYTFDCFSTDKTFALVSIVIMVGFIYTFPACLHFKILLLKPWQNKKEDLYYSTENNYFGADWSILPEFYQFLDMLWCMFFP